MTIVLYRGMHFILPKIIHLAQHCLSLTNTITAFNKTEYLGTRQYLSVDKYKGDGKREVLSMQEHRTPTVTYKMNISNQVSPPYRKYLLNLSATSQGTLSI